MGMGKTQHTEKLKEPEKGVGVVIEREEGRRINFKGNDRISTWADGPLCDIGNTRWTFHKLQLVAMF